MIEFHLDSRSGVVALPAARPSGAPGAAAGPAARGRPAAHGQGGRGPAGDQPEHGAQGLPRSSSTTGSSQPGRASARS